MSFMTPFFSIYTSLETALQSHAYSAILLDAFGVFWAGNAEGPFPGAQNTMERLFASGMKIGILSNSTQIASTDTKKYASYGFLQGKHYHFLITSGDIAKKTFCKETLPFPTPRKKYMLFCPPHPRFAHPSTLFHESAFQETDNVSEADFIYINSPHIDGEDLEEKEHFLPIVERFKRHNRPMVCANPDMYTNEGSPPRPVVRQGTIAAIYEEIGGSVFYIGKPHYQMYSAALEHFNVLSPTRKNEILMVGDTPETDMRGARAFGIHSALVTQTGIMAGRIAQKGLSALHTLNPQDLPHILIERFASYVL